jgi:predicted nucleic acid-binding protein
LPADRELPVGRSLNTRSVLLDTGAVLAFTDKSDGRHEEARQCLHEIAAAHFPLVIAAPTVFETYRRLLLDLDRSTARRFIDIALGNSMTLVDALPEDVLSGVGIIDRYHYLALSLTDAVTVAVALRLGIGQVFTFDDEFRQVGLITAPPLQIPR